MIVNLSIYWYLTKTLIPVMHPVNWYGDWKARESGATMDYVTRLLGIVQLRQLRVAAGTCQLPKQMSFLNLTCFPSYSIDVDGDFDTFMYMDRMSDAWRMKSAAETGSTSIIGK